MFHVKPLPENYGTKTRIDKSFNFEEHANHLVHVIDTIRLHRLKLKISKCSFAQSKVNLLGHVVGKGVSVDNERIEAISAAPVPRDTAELRSFLGLDGYYRIFIKGFAGISAALHGAKSAKREFAWTYEMMSAFDVLKQRLTTPPVLAFPEFEAPFIVGTDASSVAFGALLAQKKADEKVHPIQYTNRTMAAAERNYSACEREALAVIFALKKFRVYLYPKTFFRSSRTTRLCVTLFKRRIYTSTWLGGRTSLPNISSRYCTGRDPTIERRTSCPESK